jgi:large subunit ribosomal protein L23
MQAVRAQFGVHPVACNIIIVKRKPKRVRYQPGYTASWKKAIVTLRPGEVIQAFEGA